MKTFPATDTDQVTLANWRTAPFNRWAFRNVRNLVPTAAITRGCRVRELPRRARPLHGFSFVDRSSQTHDLDQVLGANHTDAFLVLHRGAIVDERYFGGMRASDPHILMSVSKSITGALSGIARDRGCLDPDEFVRHYIPEVADSTYDDARVRDLLDMRLAVDFEEDYLATEGVMIAYRQATGWNPVGKAEPPSDLRSFLCTLKSESKHGGKFRYVSPNTDLLGWLLERVGERPLAEQLSRDLWQPLGAEFDAYITVDRLGAPRAAGGICMTQRDLARVGLMMLEHGSGLDDLILDSEWVAETQHGGDLDAWREGDFATMIPDGAYANKWYQMRNDLGAFCGLGIHGQFVYVAPATSTVITRFASQPAPFESSQFELMLDMFDAIARVMD